VKQKLFFVLKQVLQVGLGHYLLHFVNYSTLERTLHLVLVKGLQSPSYQRGSKCVVPSQPHSTKLLAYGRRSLRAIAW